MAMKNGGIGLNGQMPWPRIPNEMKHFADVTSMREPLAYTSADYALKGCFFQSGMTSPFHQTGTGARLNAVIMGRKTWDSLHAKFRPLPNRINVVLTRSSASTIGANDENGMIEVYSDFEQALISLSGNPKVNEIYVIGGSTLYEQAIKQYSDLVKLVILTRINKAFEADTFMPKIQCDDEVGGGYFTKLFVSKTYSFKDITYDYCFIGNKKLL